MIFVAEMMRPLRGPVSLRASCAAMVAGMLWAWTGASVAATIDNTATVSFTGPGGPAVLASNTTTLSSVPPATPAQTVFYQYAPASPGSSNIVFDGSSYDSGGGVFAPLPDPLALDGTPIPLAAPILVRPTDVFHINEPVFLTLADANRNLDPALRETIDVTLVSTTGDSEILRLRETGPNTGVFSAGMTGVDPSAAVTPNDGRISVDTNSRITVNYQDPFYPSDATSRVALVDPLGVIFDSVTGAPVSGISITIIDDATGLPASVLGDDGISAFPSTLVTGSTVSDSGGQVYVLPVGGFRFPFVAPGNYRFQIGALPNYTLPSAVPTGNLANDGLGNPYSVVPGSRGEVFAVVVGPALNIDIPADPVSSVLYLRKNVSRTEASAGDFLQYELELRNNAGITVNAVQIDDLLPFGMRYQSGSQRRDNQPQPDPVVGTDGRALNFSIGDLAAGATVRIRYVVKLGAGVMPGEAVNTAVATSGTLSSNPAQAAVRVREALMSGRFTLIGRVYEGACASPTSELKGVPNVRVLLEDGTYAVTDKDGQYHFEALQPGTHVVQVDVDSLPPGQTMQSCVENTRFAGREFSQFVDVKGGGLWRADFYTRKPPRPEVGIRLHSVPLSHGNGAPGEAQQRVEIDGSAPVENLNIMVMIPEGASYVPGSTRVDGQPAPDPALADSLATFSLGAEPRSAWKRTIEFRTLSVRKPSAVAPPVSLPESVITSRQVFNARFDRCSNVLPPIDRVALDKLLGRLRANGGIVKIELLGYADSRTLSNECEKNYRSNDLLSQARAQALGDYVIPRLGLTADQVRIIGLGTEGLVIDNKDIDAMAKNRSADFIIYVREAGQASISVAPTGATANAIAEAATPEPTIISTSGGAGSATRVAGAATEAIATIRGIETECVALPLKALASFDNGGARLRTPVAETAIACPQEAVPAPQISPTVRQSVNLTAPAAALGTSYRAKAVEDAEAAGAKRDWFAGRQPGVEWLFPELGHNPRSPAVRIVIKHAPGQAVVLKHPDGQPLDALNYDGAEVSADQKIAISVWRGVPVVEGNNKFTADIFDAGGNKIQEISRDVHYANAPVRAVLVPEQSVLRADGIHPPVIAVRFLDRHGKPVRAGVSGPLNIRPPYRSQQEINRQQTRQLAGMDRFDPIYVVEGDEGIAYIELAPTTESGTAQIDVGVTNARESTRREEIRVWLEPQARDWVVVGFAEGTVGYNTLKDNTQALAGQVDDGTYTDGQVSLYAKGRVLGKWILTMAFDSDKPDDRRQSLLGTIDPNQYYTLYGDGSEQRHDAPSQDKLYLKLERGQFYALFGDYETGLNQTQLSRYSRTLNGVKAENGGGPIVFTLFAAETPQYFAHDEIQGDGTSGLYRLRQRGIVLNSEKIRIETRDRLQGDKLIASRPLARHIDYDIDYANGTLFFRQPVLGRDAAFNPNIIVAEYETLGVAEEDLNAGGRVGVNLDEGRVQAGFSAIRDENRQATTDLVGADLKLRLGSNSELRVEAAQTRGQDAALSTDGVAWLTEFEHHSGQYDALLYVRRQEPGFGLNQQSFAAAGQQKIGVQARARLSPIWSVQGEAYQQENLGSETTRDAVQAKLRHETPEGSFSVGAQSVTDRSNTGATAGQDFRSEQATLSASRWFLDRKLELSAQGETALGGRSDSVDYPDRYLLGAGYALTEHVRLIAGQEFTDGAYDTSTTRVGLQAQPWKGARLDSTLNQSQMSEYGPRTFAQMGMTQAVMLNERWGLDFSADSSHSFNHDSQVGPQVNSAHPVTAGGTLGGAGITEDFVALSAGATYRAPLWSWNGRAETRDGETTDRYGLVSHFLRQAQAGVAFASSARVFRTEQFAGATSRLASLDLSLAWRPLGLRWAVLDRMELRYESVENGSVLTGAGLLGNNSLSAGNARSRRIINNFALNHVARGWTEHDRQGNLFTRHERSQWSLYYGSKYVLDQFDGVDYVGYTDLIATQIRYDIKSWLDIGLHAASLNSWKDGSHAYSYGPSIGFSPVTNGWISVGYNVRGFTDRDFDAARYTAQGFYLQLRFKFDQNTRWGRNGSEASTETREADKP